MKKILYIFTLLCFFMFGLCGCVGQRELDKGYMLTAIGFEGTDSGISVIAELITVSDMQNSSPEPQVLSAKGDTPEDALYKLSLDFPRAVYFDHCAALAIGQGIDSKNLEAVIKYCATADNLNLNMYVIYCPDIESVFNTPTVSSAVGYHIMRLLNFKAKESGIDYNSRFYEIRHAYKDTLFLPTFSGGEEISLEGSIVFKNKKISMALNNTESIAYTFISGSFKNGRVSIGDEYADIKRVKYKFSAVPHNNTLDTEIIAKLDGSDITSGFYDALQSEVDALIARTSKEDIFEVQKSAVERGMTFTGGPQSTEIKYKVEKK